MQSIKIINKVSDDDNSFRCLVETVDFEDWDAFKNILLNWISKIK